MNIKNNHFISLFLFAVIILNMIISYNSITDKLPSDDGLENLKISYNLYKYNIFSLENLDTLSFENINKNNLKTNLREPLYPIILSIGLKIINFEKNLNCLLTETKCSKDRALLKILNLILFSLIIILSFIISKFLKLNDFQFFITILLIGFANYFGHVDRFFSEILSTVLILINLILIINYNNNKKNYKLMILSISFGLLILNKQIFFYWLYFFLISMFISKIINIKNNFNYKNIFIIFITSLIITAPWQLRNYNYLGKFEITGGGRAEANLSIRAYYNDIKINEYLIAYVYFIPGIGNYIINKFQLSNNVSRLNYLNEKSFYMNGINFINKKFNNKTEFYITNLDNNFLRDNSTNIIFNSAKFSIQNFHKHILNIPLLIYRSLFINHSQSIYYLNNNIIYKILAIFYLFIFSLPIFILVLLCYKIEILNFNNFIIVLPILFFFIFYSNLSNYLPRFNMPIYPLLYISFTLTLNKIFK